MLRPSEPVNSLSYRLQVSSGEESAFSAWSLLSLTSTAQGVLAYPDELGVRYVYDTAVPNSRYVAVGDLAVIRDNRGVLGAGWIDSIEAASARKVQVPELREHGLQVPQQATARIQVRPVRYRVRYPRRRRTYRPGIHGELLANVPAG